MPESDRDILIEVRTKIVGLHTELLGGDGRVGRVPALEKTQDDHAAQINTFSGGLSALKWIIGGIGLLLLTLGATVLAHVLGGK